MGKRLAALPVKIHAWAIDANGVANEPALSFAKASVTVCGIPCCGFIGRANDRFSGLVKSRLRDENGTGTVLCGNPQELAQPGAGWRWVNFNSDLFRERVHMALLAERGQAGGMTLYRADKDNAQRIEFANQITNETLKFKKTTPRGV